MKAGLLRARRDHTWVQRFVQAFAAMGIPGSELGANTVTNTKVFSAVKSNSEPVASIGHFMVHKNYKDTDRSGELPAIAGQNSETRLLYHPNVDDIERAFSKVEQDGGKFGGWALSNNAIRSFALHDELALLYHKLGKPDKAIICLERVIELNPGDASAFNNLGVLCYQIERWDDAIRYLKQAVTLDSNYSDAWYNLGRVFHQIFQVDNAAAAWRECLACKPDHEATLRAIKQLPLDKVKVIAAAMPTVSPIHGIAKTPFTYSQEWYDKAYHVDGIGVNWRKFSAVNNQYEQAGYRSRLNSVLDEIQVPNGAIEWLEAGCHLGLTAYWVATRFPQVRLHMIDFSRESILWCQQQFPFQDKAVIWQASVECIQLPHNDLAEFFDFTSCIDVTEHLPAPVYKAMIGELWRTLKPGGHLILMQGNTPNVEHIHILPEDELVADFTTIGFDLVKHLPYRHYLLRKKRKAEK
ncbi:MAG TPA: tetratricopeptide repeat protein, partial [Candidatus Wunengus sp. YC60]|uniref:tetratricopeptide repeat protein n=1 Tax=Candidatus Wunengus sp. YC60 TaxID=3367697 RepID=UPI0040273062